MEIKNYVRKPFDIDAVQVTESNIDEVAAWCDGEIHESPKGKHIKVQVYYPLNSRRTRAYVGDWVLKSERGCKIYTDKAFRRDYLPNENQTLTESWNEIENKVANVFDQPEELMTVNEPVVDSKDAIRGKQ